MYKDKDRQREANRKAQVKFKAKAKGITGMGITGRVLPPDVQQTIDSISTTPEEKRARTAIALSYLCMYPDRYHPNSDAGFATLMAGADPKTRIKVPLPGDVDYIGVCLDGCFGVKAQ